MANRNRQIGFGEMSSFGASLLAQNLIFGLISSYLLKYYTDVVGLGSLAGGTTLLVARIWDAFMDPVMGTVADKTRTRWGKFRPYLLFGPGLLCVMTALLFNVPHISAAGMLVYAYITYILWGMVYTISDIPMWSLSAVMSTNARERNTVFTVGRIAGTFGLIVTIGFGVQILNRLGGFDTQAGFGNAALLFGVIAFVLMTSLFFFARERAPYNKVSPKMKEIFKVSAQNGPLLILVVLYILMNTINNIIQAMSIYFVTYNLVGDPAQTNLIASVNMELVAIPFLFMLLSLLTTQLLIRHIDKKTITVWSFVLTGAVNIIFFFVGYRSMTAIIVISAIRMFLMGITIIVMTTMIADCIDYVDYKYRLRLEGVAFALQTFGTKCATGLGAFLSGAALAAICYVPNRVQSPSTLNGLFVTMSLVPAVFAFATAGIALLYPLTDKKMKKISDGLKRRNAPTYKSSTPS